MACVRNLHNPLSFFFSSRRRHTISYGDWSSDVCSSDLEVARFRQPRGLILDPDDGSLYVADTGNHAIRRIDSGGRVTTLAGNGKPGDVDGPAAEARLNNPTGLALAPDKTFYFTEPHRVRALGPDGSVRTIAGSTVPGYRTGQRTDARFSN